MRFSLGRFTVEEEIDFAIEKVIASVMKLRRNSAATAGIHELPTDGTIFS
jgi:cysteine sulfinate desulfinase/cysteine desulfurase-like protein